MWKNIIFFAVTTLVALIGCPLYFKAYGLPPVLAILTYFYMCATGLAITMGYHRLYAHRTYDAHPILHFLILFFGAASFEQSALDWSSQHRDHHKYVDTERDPYNIKKGFFYAHMGWLIFWSHTIEHSNAQDLRKNALVENQHRFYLVWAFFAGVILPVLIGAFFGPAYALGAFIFAVCFRITFIYHSTFCINSVCHMFGKPTYDIHGTARDHWFVALLTNGEGYHNFHHRFAGDYRNGVRWYQYDPSKWAIFALSWIGLTSNLRRVSRFTILEARLAAERQHVDERLHSLQHHPLHVRALEIVRAKHAHLVEALSTWEVSKKEYQALLVKQVHERSSELHRAASKKLEMARLRFEFHERQWSAWVRPGPLDLTAIVS